ncbi:hypothetical protein OIV83_001618 [Microbotryomycetes sp. JL201]|nr:hypothetical protein OIV83_001618 [Microbotryomycetes sp. JL201]
MYAVARQARKQLFECCVIPPAPKSALAQRRWLATESSAAESSDAAAASSATSSESSASDQPSQETQEATDEATTAGAAPAADLESATAGRGFRAWLNGEGARYRNGIKGKTNWIGDTPFPLNPSFKPLPPLADALKTRIYNAYTFNIVAKDATDSQVVRAISAKFGVAMDRVRAIIRLKELEKSWKDSNVPLQTELLAGMESHLGVKAPSDKWQGIEVAEASKHAYARKNTVFEMVDVEGNDTPVFLPMLASLPPRPKDKPVPTRIASDQPEDAARTKVVPASRPGRPALLFKDVSGTTRGQQLAASYNPNKTKRGNRSTRA